jgi:hypothetical protein
MKANGFSNSIIQKVKRVSKRKPQQASDDIFYLRVPFVSNALNTDIKKALKPLHCSIQLAHKNPNLRKILNSKNSSV